MEWLSEEGVIHQPLARSTSSVMRSPGVPSPQLAVPNRLGSMQAPGAVAASAPLFT